LGAFIVMGIDALPAVHLSRSSRERSASVAKRVRVSPAAPPSPASLRAATSPAKSGRGVHK